MEELLATRRVWIPNHPVHAYVPGQVQEVADDGTLLATDEDGGRFRIPSAEAQSVDPACLGGVDDLLQLGDFNEAALLHNIRVRYFEDKIYTGIGGPILISVNPYTHIDGLYGLERQRQYRNAGGAEAPGQGGGPPAHLYAVADRAYATMLSEQLNQSIVISGESGAGKTEATKRVLAYFADRQRSEHAAESHGKDARKRTVEQHVLDANPVLEAFGNAKTIRNDNSSRFGKFIEVEFDASGRLLSAQISNYLLEKCRIVTQQPNERNYHIFYQLCAGAAAASSELPEGLQLGAASDFEYARTCDSVPNLDDGKEFADILDRMLNLGFSPEERGAVIRVVAAVLHLGNLSFAVTPCARDGQDRVAIGDTQATLICNLLGLEVQQFQGVLEHKTLEDPLTKKTIHMPHDLQSASHTRHSMAKVAYARLFDWLVWRINESISGHAKARKDLRRIGILDIYGFEVFEWNSFEQLCINFANEKLQQHFNTHMFTLEQRLYNSEGITWSHITWQDNQHIIDSLDKKPLGLFYLVDSECLMMPSATDNSLLGKIYSTFKNSKIICKPSRFASTEFSVAHYAGEVVYSVETFLEKNTDKLHGDIVNLFKTSKLELVRTIFTDPRFSPDLVPRAGSDMARGGDKLRDRTARRKSTADNDQRRERQNVTVSMMFREQLDKLVEDLNKTNPRYVRCIKPNASKETHQFDSIDVLRQLRCAGMLESIRIRRAGYAVRRPFKDFFSRFRTLTPHLVAAGADPDYRALCQRLATDVEQRLRREGVALEGKSWQMGQTRFFMKEELERHFERLLVESSKAHVLMLQKSWRGYARRKRFRALRGCAAQVQAALRTCRAVDAYTDARKRHAAILVFQAALRACAARSAFTRRRGASVCIQRFARGRQCRSRIGRLRSKAAEQKIQKYREEQGQRTALQNARHEAHEKDRALAEVQQRLEEVQRQQSEACEKKFQSEGAQPIIKSAHDAQAPLPSFIKDLQEENRRLLEYLRSAEAKSKELTGRLQSADARNQELAEDLRSAGSQNDELKEQNVHLRHQSGCLHEDLRKAVLEKEHLQASMATNSNAALASLRSEILSRIGETSGVPPPPPNGAGHALGSALKSASPTLASSLRPAGDDFHDSLIGDAARASLSAGRASLPAGLSEGSTRNTLVCQREIFEQLKQKFQVAQGSPIAGHGDHAPQDLGRERFQDLEDGIRRLQLENATLKTNALSAREETIEREDDAAKLLQQVSSLQAEVEDLRYQHKAELLAVRQQLKETATSFEQQTEDMVRLNSRAMEAEHQLASFHSQFQRSETDNRMRLEQVSQLEKTRSHAAADEVEALRREREKLQADFRAKENELANIKRVLDDVMSVHAPVEEVQKWKSRAEKWEQQYHQVMRYNREMSSAVGHMTHAASERGRDWSELQDRNVVLRREQERKDQDIKTAELEKQDLQKQLDSLQSTCSYFQKKYNELKSAHKMGSAASDGPSKAQLECEGLRSQTTVLRQQCRDMQAKGHENSQRLLMVGDGLKALAAAQAEQLRLHEQVSGHIPGPELRRASQEAHDRAHAVVAQMRSLLGGAGEPGLVGIGAELDMTRQLSEPPHQGRASLLTQICGQRPGVAAHPAGAGRPA